MKHLRVLAASLSFAPALTACVVPDAPFQATAASVAVQAPARGRPAAPSLIDSLPRSARVEVPPATPSLAALPAAPKDDQCGAGDLAYLVGKSRMEIPVPADLTHRRVVCTTCPSTQDVRSDRQTITYDSATNLVTKVACG